MNLSLPLLALSATLLASALSAQSPSAKPANATGQCKDGSFSTAAGKSGACRGHNGVKDWYAAASTPASPIAAKTPGPTAAPTKAAAPVQATAPAQSATTATKPAAAKGPKANLAGTPAAAGGGPGLVWVNTSSNVYHCYGADFYGKTKAGAYMSESDAKAKGARPDHGKACTK